MPDRLSKVAAFILGPSAKDDDDQFETEFAQSSDLAEEQTDIIPVDAEPAPVRERPRPLPTNPVTSLDQRRRTAGRPMALSEIVHVRPYSFAEAAVIGESFKEGLPIILNLMTTDEKQAQKLIDFAAGMAFVTDGKLERITSRVFILIPSTVSLTETDKHQLAQSPFPAE